MRTLLTEMKKTIYSPVTVFMMLAVAGVCMLSEGYVDAYAHSNTVLSLLFSHDTELFVSDVRLNQLEIWRLGFGTWTYILLPLLLPYSYIHMLSEERMQGGTQFYLIREGRVSYCISKTISAMVSGGLILLAGYLLYGLIIAVSFPKLSAYPEGNVAGYLEQTGISEVVPFIFSRCFWVFLYGMMVSIFGYLVSLFFTEKYVLLCFPMMLSYAYSSVYNRMEIYLLNQEKWELHEKSQIFNINNLLNGLEIKSRISTLSYLLVLYFGCMLLFLIIMKRKEVR